MRKLSIVVTALCVCTAFAVVASAQEKTLCERLGGTPAISAVVDSFAGKVLNDDRVNRKFAKSDANRLVTNLKGSNWCRQPNAPGVTYKGKNMKNAHKNMGVTEGEFNAVVEDLVKTLDEFKVPEKEKGELLAAPWPHEERYCREAWRYDDRHRLASQFQTGPSVEDESIYKADVAQCQRVGSPV